MAQEIKKAIIATLAYFDIFDFPLKQEEIWQWLFSKQRPIDRKDFLGILGFLGEEGVVVEKDGFYFFPGRENILAVREQRSEISEQKIKKAKRLVRWWLKHVPWIKAIFLTNSASYHNALENSDIDLFIIAQKNRLWLTRFLAVLPLKILNLRPTKKNKKDKFCLSYFVSKDNLNLEKYELVKDFPILVYWSTFYLFLSGNDDWQKKFWQANEWIKKYLPNFRCEWKCELDANGNANINSEDIFLDVEEISGSGLVDWMERWLKKFQLWYLPQELKKAAVEQNENCVYLNDNIIELHLESKIKGKEIWEKWRERMN